MASDSDMLNIGSIRLKKEYPIAGVQPRRSLDPVLHPDAAAAARQRIQDLPDAAHLLQGDQIPAAPTAQLVTDKATLAQQMTTAAPVATSRKIPSALRPMITALGIFLLVLLLFKAPIILSQLGYSFGNSNNAQTTSTAPAVTDVVPAANTISIPKINVHAPVVYEPSVQEVRHPESSAKRRSSLRQHGHSRPDW